MDARQHIRQRATTALAATWLALAGVASASVYSDLMAEFRAHDNRLAGSTNLDACRNAVAQKLKAAGLDAHEETFDTLVPVTEWCRLTVDGRSVGPVYPLDNGVTPLCTAGEIAGPLVWGGDGSLPALGGKPVEGEVVMLDFDAPRVTQANAFSQGARAVIFVGTDKACQWNVAGLTEEGPVALPQIYIDRETARKGGLLDSEGKTAAIDVRVTLRDVVARNLWAEIPGKPGTRFRQDQPETVILSATLDTHGVLPDLCPQVRGAANAALLADVACRLAGKPLKRSVMVVFFGSHYSGQEGARYLYYAAQKVDDKGTRDALDVRLKTHQDEWRVVTNLLAACDRTDLFDAKDETARALTLRIKARLVGRVNDINAEIRSARVERMALQKSLQKAATASPPLPTGPLNDRIAVLQGITDRLMEERTAWNGLREQINEFKFRKDDPKSRTAFQRIAKDVQESLSTRQDELTRLIGHLRTVAALSAHFEDRVVIGHFDFDFASDREPWLFSVAEPADLATSTDLDPGSYLMHLSELGRVYSDIRDRRWKAPLFTDALTPFYKPFALCVPVARNVPSSAGLMMGIPGFQLMTLGASLDEDELPIRADCDLSGLAPQMAALAEALGNRAELSLRNPFKKSRADPRFTYLRQSENRYDGVQAVDFSRNSSDVEGPARRAVIMLRPSAARGSKQAGLSRMPAARINADGYIFMPMINRDCCNSWGAQLLGFGYDAQGRVERYSQDGAAGWIDTLRLPLFYGYGGGAYSFGFAPDPLGGAEFYTARTLDTVSGSPYRNSCNTALNGLQCLFADKDGRFKRIGDNGQLILGSTATAPEGNGIPLDSRLLLAFDGVAQCASDYWLLNESRLKVLRERNIVSDAMETIHAESHEHLDDARKAADNRDYAAKRAHNIVATCLENRIYGPLRGITDDLVKAVVVLLLLNIPFAFALERLVFGFTNIYKQVIGFVVFFLITFAVLYVTHPAFSLASAPIVIFLAFVIILLSVIAIRIVMGKIRQEIRAIQGLASTVHGVESDSSTAMAAVMIGIAGMRNRPLKTILTAITVILLTFTILIFASFTSRLGVVETYLGKGQDEDRIELHRFSYLDMDASLIDAFDQIYGRDYRVCRRAGLYGYAMGNRSEPERVALNPATGRLAGLETVLGVEPAELQACAKLNRLLPGFTNAWPHPPLYLPAGAVAKLGVTVGDEVRLMGRPFTFAGQFGATAMLGLSTIDETRIVPPDFTSTAKNLGKKGDERSNVAELEQADVGNFAWFSPEQVAVTDLDTLHRYYPGRPHLYFATLYPRSGETDVESTGRSLAAAFQGAVHVKSVDGARKLFFTRAVAGSGFGDVIVPLLLGGLIIFSSLMGSIVDREREIFTYSALGLSPPNVGALFFAESCVYSVVGGLGGYLLSQMVAYTLVFLGSHGVFHPPDMNFSSLSSVLTILIVMAVVMLSTIYPAIKAGRSANPGVARRWKMPAPAGSQLAFVFPFTVSAVDFSGILSFIKEHFENHGDATLGNFAAREVRLFKTGGTDGTPESLGISAEISLAPFDLGIFQHFRMYSRKFDIPGIDEVVVEVERVGGTHGAWLRGNREFAAELRRQFLLWRSLPLETVQHYRQQTEATIQVDPGAARTDEAGAS